MARKRKYLDNPDQLTIFDLVRKNVQEREKNDPLAGSMDIDTQFRAAISEAIKNCDLSRPSIAAKMTELLGREITVSMLNSWTAESKENNNLAAKYLHVFCIVTGSNYPIRVITRPVGLFVMESPDAVRSEVALIDERIQKLQAEKKGRRALLKELERRV